jgi:protein SCO1
MSNPLGENTKGSKIILCSLALMLLNLAISCSKPSTPAAGTAEKRYQLKGKIVSIDKPNVSMVVDAEAIPGFMGAMAMPYKVKNAAELTPLSIGDSISADVVVQGADYWLENVKVVERSQVFPSKPGS